MHFYKIETCLYFARETVRRYGTMETQKHFGLAYGDIENGKIKVTTNTAGVYHVILHAERDYAAGPD